MTEQTSEVQTPGVRYRVEPWRWSDNYWCVTHEDENGHVHEWSRAFESKELAEAHLADLAKHGTCKKCGDLIACKWMEEVNVQLREHQLCFTCNFWREKVEHKAIYLIVDGRCYHVAREDAGRAFRGFGGTYFRFETFDGRTIESTNVWTQGEVPAWYRDELPDNARIVR